MKAFLIDAYEQTIESDDVRGGDDRLFFDEECFIRQQARPGRFQLDTLPPVAGRGVVVGGGPDESALRGPEISLEELRGRVKFSPGRRPRGG